jgi:hypothetical protein
VPIPECPSQGISMDFNTCLPSSNGFDGIWIVVNHLTKLQYFDTHETTIDAKGLAQLFIANIFCLHGFANSVISDQGLLFTSHLWKYLYNVLKIKLCLSIAFNPKTHRQME